MEKEEFLSSLKSLVVDGGRAEKAYRDMMENRYNASSSNHSDASSSDSSNIQEIAYEKSEDDDLCM